MRREVGMKIECIKSRKARTPTSVTWEGQAKKSKHRRENTKHDPRSVQGLEGRARTGPKQSHWGKSPKTGKRHEMKTSRKFTQ